VADSANFAIQEFDLNLILIDSIPTLNDQPYSIQGYRNYIYSGIFSKTDIIVIESKVIIKRFTVCANSYYPTSFIIDHFDEMAISCSNRQAVKFYFTKNGSFTGMNLNYPEAYNYMNFDSNGRFVFI
jgi:hypothetical protein